MSLKIKNSTPDFYNMRDEFASKAMQGFNLKQSSREWCEMELATRSDEAYRIADAMLKARVCTDD